MNKIQSRRSQWKGPKRIIIAPKRIDQPHFSVLPQINQTLKQFNKEHDGKLQIFTSKNNDLQNLKNLTKRHKNL